MDANELKQILDKHKKWLNNEEDGVCADLRRADMRGADMSDANMRGANISGADMSGADMRGANMRSANMSGADMSSADMRGADMSGANMRSADMRGADMSDADMRSADMRGADMSGADMRSADMRSANMRSADIDYSAWPLWCGSLKAHVDDRIAVQLLYHTLSVVQHSPYVSEELKRTLLAPPVVDIANRFHRVGECGELAVYAAEGE